MSHAFAHPVDIPHATADLGRTTIATDTFARGIPIEDYKEVSYAEMHDALPVDASPADLQQSPILISLTATGMAR